MNKHDQSPMDWQHGMPSLTEVGGLAVAHYRMRFLGDQQGVLFPREWLRAQIAEHSIAEQGVGYLNGEAVFMFELAEPVELPGMHWQDMRDYMLEGQLTLFHLLAFASQVGTWAREHRFCGSCGQAMQQADGHRRMECESCRVQQYPHSCTLFHSFLFYGCEQLECYSVFYGKRCD